MKLILCLIIFSCIYFGVESSKIQPESIRIASPGNRIVGGSATTIDKVPYLAALQQQNPFGIFEFLCGSSIISEYYLVTAAGCVTNELGSQPIVSDLQVRVGSTDRTQGGTLHSLDLITRHPNYNSLTHEYDVAVLRTSIAIQIIAPNVATIPLATVEPVDGTLMLTAGWGSTLTGEDLIYPTDVHSVILPIVDRAQCNQQYYNLFAVTARMICAGGEGKHICHGDRGGPLVQDGVPALLSGIVSFGIFGVLYRPDVFTSVSHPDITAFIQTNTP